MLCDVLEGLDDTKHFIDRSANRSIMIVDGKHLARRIENDRLNLGVGRESRVRQNKVSSCHQTQRTHPAQGDTVHIVIRVLDEHAILVTHHLGNVTN